MTRKAALEAALTEARDYILSAGHEKMLRDGVPAKLFAKIDAALEPAKKPEGDPVAWRYRYGAGKTWKLADEPARHWAADHPGFEEEPLYAFPPHSEAAKPREGSEPAEPIKSSYPEIPDNSPVSAAKPTAGSEPLTLAALNFDIDGDNPLSDELTEAWQAAMEASEKCMPPYLRGFSEWCGRTQAACAVLIERLPAIYARATAQEQRHD